MLEIGYFSLLYAQFHLLIVAFFKQKYGQRIMLRKGFTQKVTMIMWLDYSNEFFI